MSPDQSPQPQSVQNAAARFLTGTRRGDHISPVLCQLHWLPVHCSESAETCRLQTAVSITRLCPPRHPRTRLTTCTWFWKVVDVGSARPPTGCALLQLPRRPRTQHISVTALLLPGHVFRSLNSPPPQHTCTTP